MGWTHAGGRTGKAEETLTPIHDVPAGKPILCLDFDGVCHSYTSGWQGADVIPDGPVPGLFEFLEAAVDHFDVAVFSSRTHQVGGQQAMAVWFEKHWKVWADAHGKRDRFLPCMLSFPATKPAAFVTLDDRGILFEGTWPSVEALQAFRPWYRR